MSNANSPQITNKMILDAINKNAELQLEATNKNTEVLQKVLEALDKLSRNANRIDTGGCADAEKSTV